MNITNATYITSVVNKNNLVDSVNPEIAVAGRSNVGKSSFINFLTGRNKLARTSSDPGRTRMVNYFDVNNGAFTLVDLPGYGFAKVSDAEKEKWGDLIEGYLLGSKRLVNVFVLVDIRIDASPLDAQLLQFLYHYGLPFTIIATKADKLSKSQIPIRRQKLANAFGVGVSNIIVVSSFAGTGKQEVLNRIEQLIEKPQ